MRYKPSYYNLVVEHRGWTLLFNGISSGLMQLPQALAADLRPYLGSPRSRQAGGGLDEWEYPTFEPHELPTSVRRRFSEFEKGRVFLPADQDEQQLLKDRYENLRRNSPLFVTITATMDCNLRCYYCYENRSKVYLSRKGCDAILTWIQSKNLETRFEKLYTDWYGARNCWASEPTE